MFKSVFAKYETAFMTIITLGFAMLLLVITSIVGNYAKNRHFDDMKNAARVGGAYVQMIADGENEDFSTAWSSSKGERFSKLFSAYGREKSISFFILDQNGVVLTEVSSEESPHALVGSTLPCRLPQESFEDVITQDENKTHFCFFAVYEEGEICAWVAVSSYETFWGHMMQNLSKTVVSAALMVLLATMIAAYIITSRTTEPLREMSNAARSFAAGHFDVRVKVKGRDEVSELAEAFNQMADSLANLEEMRRSFVANVSHDLRTPMTTIAGFIDGIRDGVIPPEEQDRYLAVVSQEIHRLSRLVNELLDISRIQAGERKFVYKPFDVCEMARQILISFESEINEKQLEVAFECSQERMGVNADYDAIYQVFYNVCHNAVKFSRPGGILRISLEESKNKRITVSIFNEGQGIAPEELGMVFERFYKSDKSRGLDRTGTGLGLYISQAIISAHGERIWAESEYGKSCTFYFTLTQAPHGLPQASDTNADYKRQ